MPPCGGRQSQILELKAGLALARLEAAVRLVDDIDAALAPDHAVVAMPAAQRAKGIADFHGSFPFSDAVLGAGCGRVNRAKKQQVSESRQNRMGRSAMNQREKWW